MPEIEQGLSEAAGTSVKVSFTPHLMNLSRQAGGRARMRARVRVQCAVQ